MQIICSHGAHLWAEKNFIYLHKHLIKIKLDISLDYH